ncbi:MAG: hypothetical protein WCT53_00460 [Candidatus Gracilibacteria bacterium]
MDELFTLLETAKLFFSGDIKSINKPFSGFVSELESAIKSGIFFARTFFRNFSDRKSFLKTPET